MPFLKDSVKVETSDGLTFRLSEPLEFYSRERACTTTVPAGFESDGASTPRLVWNIVPPFGKYLRAAVLHDWLYRETWLPREFCDGVFLEAMVSLGVSAVERVVIYEGVRMGGALPFKRDREALERRGRAGLVRQG